YKQGKFSRIQFTCDTTGANAVLEIGAAQGDYDGKLSSRTYMLKINRKVTSLAEVSRNGSPLTKRASKAALDTAKQGWFNDTTGAIVWVKFTTPTSNASKILLDSPDFKN